MYFLYQLIKLSVKTTRTRDNARRNSCNHAILRIHGKENKGPHDETQLNDMTFARTMSGIQSIALC